MVMVSHLTLVNPSSISSNFSRYYIWS